MIFIPSFGKKSHLFQDLLGGIRTLTLTIYDIPSLIHTNEYDSAGKETVYLKGDQLTKSKPLLLNQDCMK
jgi:hypothetical protein